MTKKKLLEAFEGFEVDGTSESRLDYDYGNLEEKKRLVCDSYRLLKASLLFCPDEFSLDGISSLQVLDTKEKFKNFVYQSSVEDIKMQFKAIEFEINSLADIYTSKNVKKLRDTATVLAVRNEWLNERQARNHKIVFPIFISLFVIFSLAVLAFAVMDSAEIFAAGTPMAKACAIITAAAGALDVAAGIGFFIYERRDDQKKKENQNDLDGAITGKRLIKNSNNKIKAGKGSVVNIGDVGAASEDDREDLINTYIVKNSGNIIGGKSKEINIGDRKY